MSDPVETFITSLGEWPAPSFGGFDVEIKEVELPNELASIEEAEATSIVLDELSKALNRAEELQILLDVEHQAKQEAIVRHQKDIALIGEKLIEAAERNDWCSVYDREVDEINLHLHFRLPERYVTYSVSGTVTLPFEVQVSLTRNSSEEDIKAEIENNNTAYDLGWYYREITIDSVEEA